MLTKLIKYFAGAAMRRWILGAGIALVLGGGGLMWHNHKEGLRDEGRFECIQAINEQTVIDLQNALADEKTATATLRALAHAAAEENALARARLRESQSKLGTLAREMKEQKKNDKEYAAWSDTPLPAGVAGRLRTLNAGSNTHTGNEDSN